MWQGVKASGRKTGIRGMLGGQGADVENDGKPLEKDMLDYIYENKTAALIEASLYDRSGTGRGRGFG